MESDAQVPRKTFSYGLAYDTESEYSLSHFSACSFLTLSHPENIVTVTPEVGNITLDQVIGLLIIHDKETCSER
jgi:hypothetical protein